MIKKVIIIDKSSTRIIAVYPIDLADDADKKDYFDEAWENAVDDGLVDESKRSYYFIKFDDSKDKQQVTTYPCPFPIP